MRVSSLGPVMILLACGANGGCTPRMPVSVTRPAEINLKDVKRIAIGDIRGTNGEDLADELETALLNSGRFEVLDRANLEQMMREKRLSLSGQIDETQAAAIGKMLGAGVLIFGRVQAADFAENLTYAACSESRSINGKMTPVQGTCYTRTGSGRFEATLQLTDLATAKLITKQPYTKTSIKTLNGPSMNQEPQRFTSADRADTLKAARSALVSDFMKKIAPYRETIEVSFKTSKAVPALKEGIAHARGGQAGKALEVFELAARDNPGDVAAQFDLGVAYELNGLFQEALQAYEKAAELKPGDRQIAEASARCGQRASDARRLKEQGASP